MAGGYIAVKLDKNQQKEIQEVLKKAEITPVDDMHCTLIYDENNPDIDYNTESSKVYEATVTGVDKLGTAIVLLLKCPELATRFKVLKELGFEHSYDDLLLHTSLVYDSEDEKSDLEVIELLYNVGVFPKVLKFTDEYNEKLED